MKIRLDPQDEYLHALEDATNFNESMYFNVYDPAEKIGGFLRLGNRANEGYAEMTTCLYLPDGRIGFMFGRPEIANNDAFDAGGMKFEVVTPFASLRTTYTGKVVLPDGPPQVAHPRTAFTPNPWADADAPTLGMPVHRHPWGCVRTLDRQHPDGSRLQMAARTRALTPADVTPVFATRP